MNASSCTCLAPQGVLRAVVTTSKQNNFGRNSLTLMSNGNRSVAFLITLMVVAEITPSEEKLRCYAAPEPSRESRNETAKLSTEAKHIDFAIVMKDGSESFSDGESILSAKVPSRRWARSVHDTVLFCTHGKCQSRTGRPMS